LPVVLAALVSQDFKISEVWRLTSWRLDVQPRK